MKMKKREVIFCIKSIVLFSCLVFCFVISCNINVPKNENYNLTGSEKSGTYRDAFGEEYFIIDVDVAKSSSDSIEIGMANYASLSRRFTFWGKYDYGMPTGKWSFAGNDKTKATLLETEWVPYVNKRTLFRFSLPIDYEETLLDSTTFKLSTVNDSLGKISIIVRENKELKTETELNDFFSVSENDLRAQGYEFSAIRRRFQIDKNAYFISEYFMKDSLRSDLKLYHFFGNNPLCHSFFEFTLFHDGPYKDIVKAIFGIITASMYLDKCRILNPYLDQK